VPSEGGPSRTMEGGAAQVAERDAEQKGTARQSGASKTQPSR
jgi:hypothetical protein